MSREPRLARQRLLATFALAALMPLSCAAADVRVVATDCGHDVHVVARDAPLSMVLERLAQTLHFAFVYEAQSDPVITTDTRSSAADVVRSLARDSNFSLEQTADQRCTHGKRIARLSIVSDRPGASSVAWSPKPAWRTPEMERIGRLGLSDYLRSHGMDDQPVEELAVH